MLKIRRSIHRLPTAVCWLLDSRIHAAATAAVVLHRSSFANVCIGINTYDYAWVDNYWDDAYPWGYYRWATVRAGAAAASLDKHMCIVCEVRQISRLQ